VGVLDGLDLVQWEELETAGTSDEDIPGLLWAIATATDDKAALDSLGELSWDILHQGTVYTSTAPTVRFLAGLLTGTRRALRGYILDLLGDLVRVHDLDPGDPIAAEVRAAVLAQVDRMLPLLADDDPWTRYACAYALSGCPDRAADVQAAVRRRWSQEDDPRVRAGLVIAAATLDRRTDLIAEALAADQPPAVRAGAVLAAVQSGRRWPGARAVAAVRAAWRDGDPFAGQGDEDWWRAPVWYPKALEGVLEQLKPADQLPIAGALLGSGDPVIRMRAAIQAGTAMGDCRSVRRPLAEILVPALDDSDPLVRLAAADAIRRAGPAAAHVADALAAVVDRTDDEAAGQLLAALVELGDPRAAAHLPAHIRAGIAPDDLGGVLAEAGMPAGPDLLEAVRYRLAVLVDGRPARHITTIRDLRRQGGYVDPEPRALLRLLQSWGPAAAPAVPELIDLLGAGRATEGAAAVLAAIGPDAVPALPALRACAKAIRGDDSQHHIERLAVARACWHVTGDPDPAVDEAWRHVTNNDAGIQAAGLLAEIGDPARRLLPTIRRAMADWAIASEPYQYGRVEVAELVWLWTGDAGLVLPVVHAFVDPIDPNLVWGSQADAVILGVEMGRTEFVATLADTISIHERPFRQRLRAYRALRRFTGDVGDILTALLADISTKEALRTKENWVQALDLLTEFGPACEPVLPALRDFADRDESAAAFWGSEIPGRVDEEVRAAIRTTIDTITRPPAP